jgi:hypothetical protein
MNYHGAAPFASVTDLVNAMIAENHDPDRSPGADAAHPFMLPAVSTLYTFTRVSKDDSSCTDFENFISSISSEINADRPVIFSKSADTGKSGEYHVVIACRVTETEIWYFDPSPGSI